MAAARASEFQVRRVCRLAASLRHMAIKAGNLAAAAQMQPCPQPAGRRPIPVVAFLDRFAAPMLELTRAGTAAAAATERAEKLLRAA